MPRTRAIPDKRCAECPTIGRPRRWVDYQNPDWCCSAKCAGRRKYRKYGFRRRLSAATAARNRAHHRQRIESLVGRKYGELSVREIELFNLGVRVGYSKGYARAYDQQRTTPKRKAAAA